MPFYGNDPYGTGLILTVAAAAEKALKNAVYSLVEAAHNVAYCAKYTSDRGEAVMMRIAASAAPGFGISFASARIGAAAAPGIRISAL